MLIDFIHVELEALFGGLPARLLLIWVFFFEHSLCLIVLSVLFIKLLFLSLLLLVLVGDGGAAGAGSAGGVDGVKVYNSS